MSLPRTPLPATGGRHVPRRRPPTGRRALTRRWVPGQGWAPAPTHRPALTGAPAGRIHTRMDITRGRLYHVIAADGTLVGPCLALERSAVDGSLWWCMTPGGELVGAVTWHMLPYELACDGIAEEESDDD